MSTRKPATVAGRALLAWENSAEDSEEACIALFGRHWEPSDAILAIEDEARAAAESQREALDVEQLAAALPEPDYWFSQGTLIHGPDRGGIDIGPLLGEAKNEASARNLVRRHNALLDRLAAAESRYIAAANDAVDAHVALASQREALDVERLTRALAVYWAEDPDYRPMPDVEHDYAEELAAIYAALKEYENDQTVKNEKGVWYKTYIDYCVLCGHESKERTRMAPPKPEYWEDRYEIHEYACDEHFL